MRETCLGRLGALWELSECARDDADDSSNVRFGERYARGTPLAEDKCTGLRGDGPAPALDEGGEGEGDREAVCEGVLSRGCSDEASTATRDFDDEGGFAEDDDFATDLDFALDGGFFVAGCDGIDGTSGAGVSTILGRPVCGPLKHLIDEKCSQS